MTADESLRKVRYGRIEPEQSLLGPREVLREVRILSAPASRIEPGQSLLGPREFQLRSGFSRPWRVCVTDPASSGSTVVAKPP